MINSRTSNEPQAYKIKVRGRLGENWADWFDGFTISMPGAEDSMLTGTVVDQAALHGILAKIRDLGLPLLCVEYLGTTCSRK